MKSAIAMEARSTQMLAIKRLSLEVPVSLLSFAPGAFDDGNPPVKFVRFPRVDRVSFVVLPADGAESVFAVASC